VFAAAKFSWDGGQQTADGLSYLFAPDGARAQKLWERARHRPVQARSHSS
jgi:hypothetical protein